MGRGRAPAGRGLTRGWQAPRGLEGYNLEQYLYEFM